MIAQRITNLWPLTEAALSADANIDYIGARETAMADAISALYRTYAPGETVPSIAAVDGADVVIQQWVAAQTVLLLMPMAREKAGRRAVQLSEDDSGSATFDSPIKVLDGVEARVKAQIADTTNAVIALIRPVTTAPTTRIPLFTVAHGRRGG